MTEVKVGEGSSLRKTDEAAKAVQQTGNRIALDDILARITGVEYWHPRANPTMTVAAVIMDNGWVAIGESAPVDPDNYNEEVGQRSAREHAIAKLWPVLAFKMREQMWIRSGEGETEGAAV